MSRKSIQNGYTRLVGALKGHKARTRRGTTQVQGVQVNFFVQGQGSKPAGQKFCVGGTSQVPGGAAPGWGYPLPPGRTAAGRDSGQRDGRATAGTDSRTCRHGHGTASRRDGRDGQRTGTRTRTRDSRKTASRDSIPDGTRTAGHGHATASRNSVPGHATAGRTRAPGRANRTAAGRDTGREREGVNLPKTASRANSRKTADGRERETLRDTLPYRTRALPSVRDAVDTLSGRDVVTWRGCPAVPLFGMREGYLYIDKNFRTIFGFPSRDA